MSIFKKKTVTTVEETVKVTTEETKKENSMDAVAPKSIGKLDMVIAFDTTGSMASYIGAVRQEVAELIPRLFKDNDDLRLGIVAFGDYCDMENAHNFGNPFYLVEPEALSFALTFYVAVCFHRCDFFLFVYHHRFSLA